LSRTFTQLLNAYFSELKGVGSATDVKNIIEDLSMSSAENVDRIIAACLQIPVTQNLKKDFANITAIPYNKELTAAEIENILANQVIMRNRLGNELKLLLVRLFSRKDLDPVTFDGIFIRYFNLPVLYLKNELSPDGDGYILFFEMTRFKELVKAGMNEKILDIKLKRENLLIEIERELQRRAVGNGNRHQLSINNIVGAGVIVVGVLMMLLLQKSKL